MVVKVRVTYCGGWGYGSKFRSLQADLVGKFGDKIAVDGEATRGVTGYLEVEVNGTLVHSKKGGDGYVDTAGKKQKIYDAISAALN